MLYLISHLTFLPLSNLFRYISFRSGGAFFTAFFLTIFIFPKVITLFKKIQANTNNVRKYTPDTHLKKTGTPTWGGLLLLFTIIITSLLWGKLMDPSLWILILATLGFGGIGFIDDFLKFKTNDYHGLPPKLKLFFTFSVGLIILWLIVFITPNSIAYSITIPFLKNAYLPLSYGFFIYGMLVMAGTANAVNLTDGLDGLATVPLMIAFMAFGIIGYLSGNVIYANYLHIPFLDATGESTIMVASIVGALMAFLWYNAPPAKIFMGDTGAIGLGGLLGTLALLVKSSLLLVIVGGIFVLEAVSVILQMTSRKLIGKRIFAMAPIHHHFEKKGWAETTVVIRFWIIAILLAILALATLKIR